MNQQILTKELIDAGVLKTPRLIRAFYKVDRLDFVTPENRNRAYLNQPLPTLCGQTISQPLTVAFMLELLAPQPGDKILDLGAGSGWQAALLGFVVSHDDEGKELLPNERGYVISLEILPEICDLGRRNLAKYEYLKKGIVEYYCLNARNGYAEKAPYDNIIAAAALEITNDSPKSNVLNKWLAQLKIGGRLIIPAGSRIRLFRKRSENNLMTEDFEGFIFVPLV
ncbi:MAG: protein-L-isoaspartate O-methyltransferase [Candidatus Paceibacterota bacterium]